MTTQRPMRRLAPETQLRDREPFIRDPVFLTASAFAEVYRVRYGDEAAIVKKAVRADGATVTLVQQRQAELNRDLLTRVERQRALPGTVPILERRDDFQGCAVVVLALGAPLDGRVPGSVVDWLRVCEGLAASCAECHVVAALGDIRPDNAIRIGDRCLHNDPLIPGEKRASPGYSAVARYTRPFDPEDRASDLFSLAATCRFAATGAPPAVGTAAAEGERDPARLAEAARRDVGAVVERVRSEGHPRAQEALDLLVPALERGLDPLAPAGTARELWLALRGAREILRPDPPARVVTERVEVRVPTPPPPVPARAPAPSPGHEWGGLVGALILGFGLGFGVFFETQHGAAATAPVVATAAAPRSQLLCSAELATLEPTRGLLGEALRLDAWTTGRTDDDLACVFARACERWGGPWCKSEEWARVEPGWGRLSTMQEKFADYTFDTWNVADTLKAWSDPAYRPCVVYGCETSDAVPAKLREHVRAQPTWSLEGALADFAGQDAAFVAAKELAWRSLNTYFAGGREQERLRAASAAPKEELYVFECPSRNLGLFEYQQTFDPTAPCEQTLASTLAVRLHDEVYGHLIDDTVRDTLELACRAGDGEACGLAADAMWPNLAGCCDRPLGRTTGNGPRALRRWEWGCDRGFAGACVTLAADAFQLGDVDAAGAWLRKAARLGDTKAEKTRLDGPTDRDGGYAFTRGIDVDSLGHLGPWLSYQFLPRGRPPV